MTTTVQSVIQAVQVEYVTDPAGTRWPATDLVRIGNRMQLAIVMARPDAAASSVTLTLLAGHAQVLPSTALALVEILATAAGAPVRQCRREDLDAISPTWRSATPTTAIEHFMYDPRHPRRFDVYPPASEGAQLAALVAAYPQAMATPGGAAYTDCTGNIGVPDEFAPALSHLIAYGAYIKDAKYAANAGLAKMHLEAAVSMVGEQLRAQLAMQPLSAQDGSA